MKEIVFEPYEPESWDEKLFLIWLSRLPPIFKRNFSRPIPFLIAEMTLANSKITKREAREILRFWCKKGFLKLHKFKGYEVKPEAIAAIFKKRTMFDFSKNFGLEFVDNSVILRAIEDKAESDAKLWQGRDEDE
jgi:hypothetical protein